MKWCLLSAALLISFSSFSQQESIQNLQIDSTKRDTTQVHALISLSKKYQWIDSYRSLEYADQALKLARNINYNTGIAIASNLKGFNFWTFGDNDMAITSAIEALEIANAMNNRYIQAESYYILARGYMDLLESVKARESISKAKTLATEIRNWEQLSSIYNLLGVILFIENKTDSALYFYNMAFEIAKTHELDSVNFPRIISNIGECYAVENPELGFKYFNNALKIAKETGNQIAEASITAIIGHSYLRIDDLENAETHLQQALELARSLGLRRVIRHTYSGLVDIKLKQGKADEAVVYIIRYNEVRDSLLNTSKIRQIVELESKHALQLKEKDIRILENERKIQTLWNNLLIVLIVFLILLSVSIYLLQQYRHRKNHELLNLEIDHLTRQNKETETKYRASFFPAPEDDVESHDQRLLKKSIAVVEENISDPNFSVEKMAEAMNMSRTNLHRKIKSITGFPPSELIRSIRLRKAARLIINKVDSVAQIALLVGFDDYPHFSKSFKKHFGVPPTNYEEYAKSQNSIE